MFDVLLHLFDVDACVVGEVLLVWVDFGVARLGFGDGSCEWIAVEWFVMMIKVCGLLLFVLGILCGDYDQVEWLGVVTLKLIAVYAMRLVSGDRLVYKVVLFDEVWFLFVSRDGWWLIDWLNWLGCAENATLIFVT